MSVTQSPVTVLENSYSGPIQVFWNGVFSAVQFNCDCIDALHLCHGMCCTRRAGFSVVLEEDELNSFEHKNGILAAKPDGMSCLYLTERGTCGIYERRPRMCRKWHCSPKGQPNDFEIERRDAGWMLLPVRSEEAELVQLSMKGV